MSDTMIPEKPANAFRITLNLTSPRPRLDSVLLEVIRNQNENLDLKIISRVDYKELFKKKHVRIKGQPATPSSSLAAGITYVDIIGFGS